jgi:hypothetical protein
MHRFPASVVFLFALTLLGGCATGSPIRAYHDYNPAVDFASLRTWAFMSEHPMIVGGVEAPVSPLLEERIMSAIRAELASKGFTAVDDPAAADFVVSFTIGSRDQIRVDEYPVNYQVNYGRYYRGRAYGFGYGTETRVRQYTEGQLAVDLFEVASGAPAFHGSATKRIDQRDRDAPEQAIRAGIAEALAGFPPGEAGIAEPNLLPTD